jgi:hypothetical protein
MRIFGLAIALVTFSAVACGDVATDAGASGGSSARGGAGTGGSGLGGALGSGGAGESGAGGSGLGGALGSGGAGESGAGAGLGGAPGSGGFVAAGAGGDGASGNDVGGAAGGGAGGSGAGGEPVGPGGAAAVCANTLALKCGDRFNHSTLVQGRANTWSGYGRTARGESGRETVYAFTSGEDCKVVAKLENLRTDLDLLLLSQCGPQSNLAASSTPLDLQTVETLSWTNPAHQTHYVVVDGYAGAEGEYTLALDCSCN